MPTLVDEEWSDRIAIVTGAASGVGLALSAWVAPVGAKVVVVGLPGRVLERATVPTNEIERMVIEQALATGVGKEGHGPPVPSSQPDQEVDRPRRGGRNIVFLCRADMWSITGQTTNMDAGWLATS